MNLIESLPPIRRARDFHLYTENNQRILDLWRADGMALFGHKKGNLILKMKNSLEKGVLPAYPTVELRRLKKAIQSWLGELSEFIISSSLSEATLLLQSTNQPYQTLHPLDPLPPDGLLLIRLPLPLSHAPVLLATVGNTPFPKELQDRGDSPVSPYLLVAATRSIYDWIKVFPQLEEVDYSWFDRGVEKVKEQGKKVPFCREGVCLKFNGNLQNYPKQFQKALSNRILLSPTIERPSYLPLQVSDGEKALLLKALVEVK